MVRSGFLGMVRTAGAALLLSAAVMWGGCDEETCGYAEGCFQSCAADDECEEQGHVCRMLNGHDALSCAPACSQNQDCSQKTNLVCRCLPGDSGGFCDFPADDGPNAGPLNELCADDFSTAVGCDLLCACPCSFHGMCYETVTGSGDFVVDDCKGGCEAALEAFPDCSAELDAYYRCAVSEAQCIAGSGDGSSTDCPNGWPNCWGTAPDAACPGERAALETCASSPSWRFFFPVAAPPS